MFKKAQVMLLPIEKAVIGDIYLTSSKTLAKCDYGTLHLAYNNVQHLYIINDDKIENGDWYYHPVIKGNSIVQYFEEKHFSNDSSISLANLKAKKIISTTNSLKIGASGINLKQSIYLPQPSQQFIEKYIEEYNKGNIITDVLVEYEEITDIEVRYKHPFGDIAKEIGTGNYKLKIDSKNNITIRKQKDSFSREEVENLLHSLYSFCTTDCSYDGVEFDKWIKNIL